MCVWFGLESNVLILKLPPFLKFQELKSFRAEVDVDPKYHTKIIGKNGLVIAGIRQQHDVQVQFPERGADRSNAIVIIGLEANVQAAKEDILKRVQNLVSINLLIFTLFCNLEFSLMDGSVASFCISFSSLNPLLNIRGVELIFDV